VRAAGLGSGAPAFRALVARRGTPAAPRWSWRHGPIGWYLGGALNAAEMKRQWRLGLADTLSLGASVRGVCDSEGLFGFVRGAESALGHLDDRGARDADGDRGRQEPDRGQEVWAQVGGAWEHRSLAVLLDAFAERSKPLNDLQAK
jgi:hypothetical protein